MNVLLKPWAWIASSGGGRSREKRAISPPVPSAARTPITVSEMPNTVIRKRPRMRVVIPVSARSAHPPRDDRFATSAPRELAVSAGRLPAGIADATLPYILIQSNSDSSWGPPAWPIRGAQERPARSRQETCPRYTRRDRPGGVRPWRGAACAAEHHTPRVKDWEEPDVVRSRSAAGARQPPLGGPVVRDQRQARRAP